MRIFRSIKFASLQVPKRESLCRVVLRHVLKVSNLADQARKEDEAAAKQANKGKKKSAKKIKTRRVVEELDVQAIMLDLFQVCAFTNFAFLQIIACTDPEVVIYTTGHTFWSPCNA